MLGRLGIAARLKRLYPRFAAAYLTFDRRSLGLTRIFLGCLLVYDVLARARMKTWYTNDGLLPNHTHLWRPAAHQMFSLMFSASYPAEAAVLFALFGIAFFCLLIGYKTKVAHVVSFVGVVSLHSRCVVSREWRRRGAQPSLRVDSVLPMGDRFSVDAVLKSLRERRERTIDELNDRSALHRDVTPVRSLVVLGVLLELSVIYYFNALSKTGHTWHRGTAVHYVLYQERMVTWLGYLVRDYVNYGMSRFTTYATLVLESIAPILIFEPIRSDVHAACRDHSLAWHAPGLLRPSERRHVFVQHDRFLPAPPVRRRLEHSQAAVRPQSRSCAHGLLR